MSPERQLGRLIADLSPAHRDALGRRLAGAGSDEPDRTIPRRTGSALPPLSFAQQRLWFLDQLAPGNPFYNIPAVLPWAGPLRVDALRSALSAIVRRHEALRTTFTAGHGQPRQVVRSPYPVRVRLVDLARLPRDERDRRADELTAREAGAPFDLQRGPLLRASVLRLGADDYRVLVTVHHIVADGWSMGVLLRELQVLYEAALRRTPATLPELPVQYADFATWQRAWLTGDRLAQHLEHWRSRLAGVPTLDLPTDYPRPTMATFRGASVLVRVEAETTTRVRRLAAEEHATPFMVLLAGYAELLHRATRQHDLAIGMPIANRTRPELEPLIGFFVNSLVLRLDLSGSPTGRELVRRVREATVEAYQHQDLPFEKLVEELQPDRDPSRNPFTQVSFQVQNAPTATGELPTDDDIVLPPGTQTSILDLAVSLWETSTALVGMAQYSTDLFDAETVDGLMTGFTTLVAGLVERPDDPIRALPLLRPAGRAAVLARSAPAPLDLGPPSTLHALVVQACRRHPDRVAVEGEDGSLTYRDLDRWSAAVADQLRAAGRGTGDVVGVRVPRRCALVAALLGVLRSGAAFLPLDPELPASRLARMVEQAGVRTVLGLDDALSGADVMVLPLPRLTGPGHVGKPRPTAEPATVDDPAYVLFTSGSTGRPLGIPVTHAAVVNHMRWMQREHPLTETDRVLQRTPSHFDASIWEFWAPLLAGARLVMFPGRWSGDAEALVHSLAERRITVMQVVPSLLSIVLSEPGLTEADRLRRVYCGGEALSPSLVRRFHASWAGRPAGQAPELVNLYGPTETTIDATSWRCDPTDQHLRVPIGRPITNTTAYVLDDAGQPVPDGIAGELYLAGAGLSCGYLGEPRLTAERFLRDPFTTPPRLMHRTRDLVRRRADGALEFVGRTDALVKLRGHRIEPREIEHCLEEHQGVGRALVTVRADRPDDAPNGHPEGGLLVAYVVPSDRQDAAARDDLALAHVADWHAVYAEMYGATNADADGPHRPGDRRAPPADPTFDTTGWISSFDGRPLPGVEMAAWRAETVERILALRPKRVLEIGAGTGLVALEVAPHCEDYLALDFSEAVTGALARTAAGLDLGHRLRVRTLAAHDVDRLREAPFDLVVLNSVVQYFPSLAYLEHVLRAATGRLRPGGSIFVGDLRSLPHVPALHLALELAATPDPTTRSAESLEQSLRDREREERELVVDPRWLTTPGRLPGVRSAWAMPKTTPFANELTRFRCDVVLRTAVPSTPSAPVRAQDLQGSPVTDQALARLLADGPGPRVLLGLTDRRLSGEVAALEALQAGNGCTVADVLLTVKDRGDLGVDPHRAVVAAAEHGRHALPVWSRPDAVGRFDLVVAETEPDLLASIHEVTSSERFIAPRGGRWSTAPLAQRLARRLVPELRLRTSQTLPPALVPARFVVLPDLPTRPNGKVDLAALPAPDLDRPLEQADYVAPADGTEGRLATLWAEVLGLNRVGAEDNFFADLGGHSLLATRLVSRIREALGVEMPLRTVFLAPTVRQMAAELERDQARATTWEST